MERTHRGYVPGYTNQAAAFVAAKLLAGMTQHLPDYGSLPPGYGPTSPYGPDSSMSGGSPPGYGPDTSLHGTQPQYPAETPSYVPPDDRAGPDDGRTEFAVDQRAGLGPTSG